MILYKGHEYSLAVEGGNWKKGRKNSQGGDLMVKAEWWPLQTKVDSTVHPV